ncbi:MAG: hypothetical protein HS113_15325 [Verrucomicrobiales bacterium]|nr:hypothetical protein [Verrucomicrobiales bacterium]
MVQHQLPRPELVAIQTKGGRKTKWLKNALTLGLRKVYVNHKRAKRQHATAVTTGGVVIAPDEGTLLADYIQAYETVRYYHGTHDAEAVLAEGLRPSRENVSRDGTPGTLGRVFLANAYDTSVTYASDKMIGVFLPPDRTRVNPGLSPDAYYRGGGTLTGPRKQELTRDAMGCGAVFTEEAIPAISVTDTDLLNLPLESQVVLFGYIRAHMQREVPDATMRELHRAARRARRLSLGRQGYQANSTTSVPHGYGYPNNESVQ